MTRERERGREVLLVHRPRYDDWTFPKGKCLDGEPDEECALREVAEETGLRCRLESSFGTTEYLDSKERPKRVRWWLMQPVADDGFTPNDEVDEARWVTLGEARRLLTFERDRDLLEGVRSSVVLLRHASAGKRAEWTDDDRLRPLDDRGRAQAVALRDALLALGVRRVLSSPYLRCTQTVAPLAEALGSEIELDERLAEGASRDAALELLASADGAVACTHGDVVEAVIGRTLKKGAGALLDAAGNAVRALERI